MYFDFKLYFSKKYGVEAFQKHTTWSFLLQCINFDTNVNTRHIFFKWNIWNVQFIGFPCLRWHYTGTRMATFLITPNLSTEWTVPWWKAVPQ